MDEQSLDESVERAPYRLPRPPWRPLCPAYSQLNFVSCSIDIQELIEYFPGEVTYVDLARTAQLAHPDAIRSVLNAVRPAAVAVDKQHMAELLEETEFASVATLEQPDGEPIEPCNPETLLTDLPKGGTLDYFDSALTHHTCVALNEFVTMHADQDIAQSVKTRLLDSFDFDPEQRRKISIYSYLGWVGEMHDKISTLPLSLIHI